MKRLSSKQFGRPDKDYTPPQTLGGIDAEMCLFHAERAGQVWALTIKPLWAWLIVNGYKDIENRTWNTKFRGPVYIHASKTYERKAYGKDLEFVNSIDDRLMAIIPDYPTLMLEYSGRILGRVDITEVYTPNTTAFSSFWHMEGNHGFKLENARAFEVRPQYKGRLGFFPLDPDISKLIKNMDV